MNRVKSIQFLVGTLGLPLLAHLEQLCFFVFVSDSV